MSLRYIIGKRRDRKGWDVIVMDGERCALFGPFRLQREARTAISLGELGEPHTVEEAA